MLQHVEFPQPASYRDCNHAETGIAAQKAPDGYNTGISKENILLEIHNIRSIIRLCSSQPRSAASAATIATKTVRVLSKNTHQGANQTSSQSVQSGSVRSAANEDLFLPSL
jgi:hypothetical protein